MKKSVGIICLLGISLCVILAFSMCLPAFADIGTDINSYWAYKTPTINGIISPGEWSDAYSRNIVFDMRNDSSNTHAWYLNATLYVKNDYNNLYIAVKIYNDTYWAQDTRGFNKGLAIYFNRNDNGSLGQGENGEIKNTYTGNSYYSQNQLYYNTTNTDWQSVVSLGATQVGSIAFTFANSTSPLKAGALGNWTFEMQIPLTDSNPNFGFHITKAELPTVLGYKLEFDDSRHSVTGVYPDNGSNPVSQITDAHTFGDINIYPLFNLTIIAGPGGTTSPVPGTYQYGYGTMVGVTAIPNAGYVLNYWTLDAVNVGAANPYTVTMDQNHILEAFFKTAPSPVGGLAFPLSDNAAFPLSGTSMRAVAGYAAIFAIFFAVTVVIKRKRK